MRLDKMTYRLIFTTTLLVSSFLTKAQEVSAEIDRDTIKIGEQIQYKITAKIQPEDVIVFPEGQTFTPLEMVEAYKIDTTQLEPLKILSKTYALTQFDSGSYTIGKQTLKLNDSFIETDSINIRVNDVVVDTTKQKLYPIKAYIDFEKPFEIRSWIWWTLLAIVVALGLIFVLFKFKKKKDVKKKRIPPYQRAIQSLQDLDNSKLIDDRNLKEYYSQLTEISRRYLEEKVEIRALEYTSNELVDELESRRQSQKLNISQDLIDDFKKILQRADLAKFAKSAPDVLTAKSDRKNVETFTNSMQTAIPEPTDEEKKRDEAYQAILKKRRQRRKIAFAILVVLAIATISTVALVATKGYDYVKDAYFGNASKELLEQDWITSTYGYPPIQISTPEVLVRTPIDSLNQNIKQNDMVLSTETFVDGSLFSNLYVVLSSVQFKKDTEFDLKKAIDGIYKNLEQKGAINIISKDEEFESLDGSKGIKVFGNFDIKNPITGSDIKKSYQILNFGVGGNYQQITIVHDENDRFADEISNRIINTVEFNLENN
ncbi:BatD family protein [Mesohalobacter halotolerans]|uniref:DUF4381 domain-containing protein n=1 Tax=Mesohalobacter halotolerans TaxID=1883405 RepID=A0A4U5TUP9_9FLAO|nr:BatD family protein [Mesohalobacter halotolerans]TKS57018.1 hypothetical protein FCN74_00935 [Mesohalobacter halotolerans]